MFYTPDAGHPLPHNPFKAIVSPRPIGWIGTRDAGGHDNLAPYSFFNALSDAPPTVIFANTGGKPDRAAGKDSVSVARETGVFTTSFVSAALTEAMNASSAALAAGADEFAAAGLEKGQGQVVDAPFVAAAPAAFECRVWQVIELPGADNIAVIGEVVGVHIREEALREGRFDVELVQPLSRLGYRDYARIETVFELLRPGQGGAGS